MISPGKTKLLAMMQYPFFNSVGNPLPVAVTKINSWEAASRSAASRKWNNCRLMARNPLQMRIESGMNSKMSAWDELADFADPLVNPFVTNLLGQKFIPGPLLENLKHCVCWDMFYICLEVEFGKNLVPPFYSLYVDPWYAAGHFPCGWDGEEFPQGWLGTLPDGKLIVF